MYYKLIQKIKQDSAERGMTDMPINVNSKLPAVKILAQEGVFVMPHENAQKQDIRPLRISILNLMPMKMQTEVQLFTLLGCTPLQVEVTLLYPRTHTPKHTAHEYLDQFYKTFDQVQKSKFDGLIITGAPVEQLDFDQVTYWSELKEIMEWSRTNVYSTMYICWGAQAGLYYHYGIDKVVLSEKVSGIYKHKCLDSRVPLVRGFDDVFYAPHSRYTGVDARAVQASRKLKVLCTSDEVGPYIITNRNGRRVFVTGHPEYEKYTLRNEYERDTGRGLNIKIPKNYFADDDPKGDVQVTWQSHSNLLFRNWLNYYVYQQTPFDVESMKPLR